MRRRVSCYNNRDCRVHFSEASADSWYCLRPATAFVGGVRYFHAVSEARPPFRYLLHSLPHHTMRLISYALISLWLALVWLFSALTVAPAAAHPCDDASPRARLPLYAFVEVRAEAVSRAAAGSAHNPALPQCLGGARPGQRGRPAAWPGWRPPSPRAGCKPGSSGVAYLRRPRQADHRIHPLDP